MKQIPEHSFETIVHEFVFNYLRDNPRTLESKAEAAAIAFGFVCYPARIKTEDAFDYLTFEQRWEIVDKEFHGTLWDMLVAAWDRILRKQDVPRDAVEDYHQCMKMTEEFLNGVGR
jgi:hypothetical protein